MGEVNRSQLNLYPPMGASPVILACPAARWQGARTACLLACPSPGAFWGWRPSVPDSQRLPHRVEQELHVVAILGGDFLADTPHFPDWIVRLYGPARNTIT